MSTTTPDPIPEIPVIPVDFDIPAAMARIDVISQGLGSVMARADIADQLRGPVVYLQHALAKWPQHDVNAGIARLLTACELVIRGGS